MVLNYTRRGALKRIGITTAIGGLAGCSQTEEGYPSESITLVNPYPPGGGTDVYFSQFVDPLSEEYGVGVGQEYESGANGAVAHRRVMNTDSHHVMTNNNIPAHALTQLNLDEPGYDLLEFTAICSFAEDAGVIITPKDSEYTDFETLRSAYQSGDLSTFGGIGTGNNFHLTAWQMKELWDFDYNEYVGYEGGGPVISAVLREEVPAGIVATSPTVPYVEDDEVNVVLTVGDEPPESIPSAAAPSDFNLDNTEVAATGVFYRTLFGPPILTDEEQSILSEGALNALESDSVTQWSEESGNPIIPADADQTEQYNERSFDIRDTYEEFVSSIDD